MTDHTLTPPGAVVGRRPASPRAARLVSANGMETVPHLVTVLVLMSVFMFSIRLVNSPIVFLSHFVIFLVAMYFIATGSMKMNRTILFIVLFIFVHGMAGVLLGRNALFLFAENFIKLFVYYFAFSNAVPNDEKGLGRCLDIYLRLCFAAAVLGLFAILSYVVGFRYGYDFSWFLNTWHHTPQDGHFGLPRAQSIFGEPSHAIYVFGPACFVCVGRLLGNHREVATLAMALTIMAFLFMTNSTTFYLILPFAILYNLKLSLQQFAVMGLAVLLFMFFIRVDLGTSLEKLRLLFLLIELQGQQKGVSGSSYTAYVGGALAYEIFKETYGMGGGIGSFEYSFDRLMDAISVAKGNMSNAQSGGSLLARTLGELGLFGIGLWLLMLATFVKGYFRFSGRTRTIHIAMAVGMLPFLLRMGTFELFGFALFITLYVKNYRLGLDTLRITAPQASNLPVTRRFATEENG